jgi:hypothetical protein
LFLLLLLLLGLGFELKLQACRDGTLLYEPYLQSILLWYFGDGGLLNYLPRLAWANRDPLSLSLHIRITGLRHWHPASFSFLSISITYQQRRE